MPSRFALPQYSDDLILAIAVVVILTPLLLPLVPRKINTLFLLACCFIVFAEMSTSPRLESSAIMKYARVYSTFLIGLLGVLQYRIRSIGIASQSLLAFGVLYAISGLWSRDAAFNFAYNSFFFLATLAGIFMARSVRNRAELLRGLHVLAFVGTGAAIFFLVFLFLNPTQLFAGGRLFGWGMSNNLGASLAILLLINSYFAMYAQPRFLWKVVCWSTFGMLIGVIILTGSRTAAIVVLAGFFTQVFFLKNRRLSSVFFVLLATTVAYFIVTSVGKSQGFERLLTAGETRLEVWSDTFLSFMKSPILGYGTVHVESIRGGRLLNPHNIYLHTLIVSGVLGGTVLALCLLVVVSRLVKAYRLTRQYGACFDLTILAMSLLIAVLLEGIANSSTLAAVHLGSLTLGFCVGLIDQIPRWTVLSHNNRMTHIAYPVYRFGLRRKPGSTGLT